MTTGLVPCDHQVCAITVWPGADSGTLLDVPGSVGLVTTGPMRSRLESLGRCVEFGRQLLSRITPMPCWDVIEPSQARQVMRAVGPSFREIFGSRINLGETIESVRSGSAWLPANLLNRLLDDLERAAGGSALPPMSERLHQAGIQRLVIFESHHRDSDFEFWLKQVTSDVCPISVVVDPGLEGSDAALAGLPTHELGGPLAISQALRSTLALSPARCDHPPPAIGGAGAITTHQFDDVDPADFGWLAASALASTGIATKTNSFTDINLNIDSSNQTFLIIAPRQAEEAWLRFQISLHIAEPVLLLRGGRDDRAVRLCSQLLRGIASNNSTMISEVVLEGISGFVPTQHGRAKMILAGINGDQPSDWFDGAGTALRRENELQPVGTSLQRIAQALQAGPPQIFNELVSILPIEATGRTTRSMQPTLSPTIQRAASASTIEKAIEILHSAGWTPMRDFTYRIGEPRIFVTSANRIGAATADVVIILRPGRHGFLATRSMTTNAQSKVLYQCIGAARESLHLIHRGPNDILLTPGQIPL